MEKDLLVLIVIGLLFSILLQSIAFTSKYIINDDVRTALFPIDKLKDKNLFQNDLLADYQLTGAGSTKVLLYFYSFINNFIDFKIITKILPIILSIISLIFFYLTVKQFLKKEAAFISTIIFLLFSWSLQLFSGGLSRAFILPLTTLFLYYFLKDSLKSLIILIISSIFYPPLTLILSLTFLLTFINKNPIKNLKSKKFIYFLIAIIISFIIITQSSASKDLGQIYTPKEAISMEEFHSNGKIPVLTNFLTLINPYNTGIKLSLTKNPVLVLLILTIIALFFKTTKNLPNKLKLFALSGLILYLISFLFLFKIYIPIRYLIPVYLFLIFFISNKLESFNLTRKKVLIISLIFFLLFIPHLRRDLTICEYPELYNFISTLPKESLIAGFPKDLDCIPLFSKRSVLINDESNIPFYKNYYEKIRERLIDLFNTYYSDNETKIKEFCNKHKITHLLINKDRFKEEFLNKDLVYYNPFNKIIKQNKDNNFILPKLESKSVFTSNNEFIITC